MSMASLWRSPRHGTSLAARPVPLVIGHDEWRALEAGLVQRATLLKQNPRRLLRRAGTHPLAVALPRHGLRPSPISSALPRHPRARGHLPQFLRGGPRPVADGRWWVVSDRTQIPTGAGYALANRLVTSRILPSHSLKITCIAWRIFPRRPERARAAWPGQAHKARVVMLTRPAQRNLFRTGLSRRYLGYMLVEGQDLTVRDNHVFSSPLAARVRHSPRRNILYAPSR